MNSFGLRFCYFASSFQRLYCLSVEQRYENFPFLQKFSRECWLVMGLCPLIPLYMLLFFASPKKSNQKKGESCADGGPQRTACGCWLWRVAATHPAHWACPRRSACFARTRPNAAVGASGGFLVRVRFAAARVGACGGVPHARSLCINNQVLITRLYY